MEQSEVLRRIVELEEQIAALPNMDPAYVTVDFRYPSCAAWVEGMNELNQIIPHYAHGIWV